ncbi:AbrB/MazE/SpoVT family DNA-binding domain-containing protein [soil metagenome]
MKIQIQKWGNSLALRIPKSFAVETNIRQGSTVDVTLLNDSIVMKPAPSVVTLESLLSEVSDINIHGEINLGEPVGNEAW